MADGSNPLASRFLINSEVALDLAELNSDLIKAESKLAKETVNQERITAELAQREEELRALGRRAGRTRHPGGGRGEAGTRIADRLARDQVSVAGSVSALHRSLGERIVPESRSSNRRAAPLDHRGGARGTVFDPRVELRSGSAAARTRARSSRPRSRGCLP